MVTEKQKCIAEQAIYGDLAIKDIDCTEPLLEIVLKCGWDSDEFLIDTNIDFDLTDTDRIKPILRRMSDLTEEITHKGYNDDKPFVPSKHLMKILDISEFELEYYCGNYEFALYIDPEFDFDSIRLSISKMNELLDFLNMLHFDTRNLIEKCKAIDVNTLSINPYSV